MSSPLQQQDNAAAAAGLAQLAASAPTPANQVPQQIWAARPPMPFQAGQSSLFLPGFASCLGASSTQQPAAVATAQAPQGGVGRVFQRALPNGGADSGVAMAPNAFGDVATTFVVCKFKKTPSHDSEIRQGLQMCSNPKCDKAAHYECYKKEVLAKHNVRPVIFPHTQIKGSPSGEAVEGVESLMFMGHLTTSWLLECRYNKPTVLKSRVSQQVLFLVKVKQWQVVKFHLFENSIIMTRSRPASQVGNDSSLIITYDHTVE
jgi:hypothetical protein